MRLQLHPARSAAAWSASFCASLILSILATLPTCRAADGGESTSSRTVRRLDVGGHKLTIRTEGRGGPTVVIEPGMGLPAVESDEWNTVCNQIARTNLVCLYDRAGLGTSDPAPARPRTSRDVAKDLHALLATAHVPGPYVLVGHSVGGLNVRVFASLYPHDVAGIVLVDSACPNQDRKWLAALPKPRDAEDPAVTQARDFLKGRLANPAANPEGFDILASSDQASAAGTLGDKPLAVLTHSPDWKMVPDLPDDISRKLEQVTQALQNDLPRLSTNATHVVAKKAGHHIHVDEPDLVIAAIRQVAANAGRR